MTQPNLTPDALNSHVTIHGEFKYATQGQCSTDRNIPLMVLREAKKQLAPGFHPTKSEFSWTKLQPWLVQNYEQLAKLIKPEEPEPKHGKKERLLMRKLEAETIQAEIKARRESADFISRKLVINTCKRIAKEWTALVSRYLIHEQPAKCSGMQEQDLRLSNQEFIKLASSILSTPLNEWEQAKDLETEEKENEPDGN